MLKISLVLLFIVSFIIGLAYANITIKYENNFKINKYVLK